MLENLFFQNLFQCHPDHIYFKDTECRFLCVSPSDAKWLGLKSPEDAVG